MCVFVSRGMNTIQLLFIMHVKCMVSAKRIFIAALLFSSRCIINYVNLLFETCSKQISDDNDEFVYKSTSDLNVALAAFVT